jgi:hypothetical protein
MNSCSGGSAQNKNGNLLPISYIKKALKQLKLVRKTSFDEVLHRRFLRLLHSRIVKSCFFSALAVVGGRRC